MSCEHQGPKAATRCGRCSPGLRNRYFRGKLLTVDDYRMEQAYLIGRRRLITRTVHGSGVVSGFAVERVGTATLAIGPGVAFDCHGRELVACERVEMDEPDDILWLALGDCGLEPASKPAAGVHLLCAHYAEKRVDGVRVEEGCGEAVCESNHICETVVYSLRLAKPPWCPPMVRPCIELDPNPVLAPAQPVAEPVRIADLNAVGTLGLCREDRCGSCGKGFDRCCTGKLTRHGRLDVDFDAGVPLAYATLEDDGCGGFRLARVDAIARACELTRIKDIGWRRWHEHPELVTGRNNFRAMFVAPAATTVPPDTDEAHEDTAPAHPIPVDTRFWVCFSAPVQIASLTRDVVIMTLINEEDNEAVGKMVRVPINSLWIAPTLEHDPPNTTRSFRLQVRYQFWQGEVAPGSASSFSRKTLVELRIRGDLIIDWAGQPIDGNSIGHRLPSGNGSPGGEFLSSWRVLPTGANEPPRDPTATTAV